MKLIPCPVNGLRPAQEFLFGGEVREMPDPAACSDAEWADYVFNRSGEPVAGAPIRCTVLVWGQGPDQATRISEPIPAGFEYVQDEGGDDGVYEQVRDKLPYPFEDLGQLSVKNIARPVHAFALRAETIAAMPLDETPSAQPLSNASTAGSMATFVPRLSIVVLPFANLSGDTAQLYLADAVTDDLTTDLSRIPDLVVISRNTAFTYRDRPIDTRQIGRELNVRYLLQGSVRRSGKQIRVNAQLIDAESDAHLWAERFDGVENL